MPDIKIFVGDRRRELSVTTKEARKHSLKQGQTVDVTLAARITRDRVIDAGVAADRVLGRRAQLTSSKVERCETRFIRTS